MSQFDYLRDQISDNVWNGKEILKVADTVTAGISGGQEWFMNLPHIKFIMENTVMGGVKDLLTASGDLAETVVNCNLVFLETLNGVNRAFNSKVHTNLAGTGQQRLAQISLNNTEKSVYEASVMAHNESLNLPALSVQIAAIEGEIAGIQRQGASANEQIGEVRNAILAKLEALKAELTGMLEGLKGNPRRRVRRQLRNAESSLLAMQQSAVPVVIGHNFYEITSTYDRALNSIYSRSPVLNAIVPIAVGGAATVAGAASIITGIATWLLGSFFLRTFNIPTVLLPALANTVTSIVLKITGSSGADAVRFLAGSALRTGKALLPKIFSPTGMESSAWTYLMAFAAPMIAAAIIIIQSMRTKNKVTFSHFYLLAEHEKYPGFAYASIQNADDAKIEFAKMKKDLLDLAQVTYSEIHGVGIDVENKKPEIKGGFRLSTDVPVKMNSADAKKVLEDFSKKHSFSIPLGAWKPV